LEGLGPGGAKKSRKCHKCIKRKQELINLGENIKLREIMDLEDLTLVGFFHVEEWEVIL
jgi:hypothetical protein